jgi:DNA-directed RNA polymerase specialized sigma24 family protein
VVRDLAGVDDPDAVALAEVLRTAVAALGHHPRDEKLKRAVERTYLRPAPNQEAAAEVLGLPFSTYRRHLTEGVARLVARLWEQEIYGPLSGRSDHD